MKKFTSLLILMGLLISGCSSSKLKENEQFTLDAIDVIYEVSAGLNVGEQNLGTEEGYFKYLYSMQNHLKNADFIVKKWVNSENLEVKKIAQNMEKSISKLIQSNNLGLSFPKGKKELVELLTIEKAGKEELGIYFSEILIADIPLELTDESKNVIKTHIEKVFKSELDKLREYGKDGADIMEYKAPPMFWYWYMFHAVLLKDLKLIS